MWNINSTCVKKIIHLGWLENDGCCGCCRGEAPPPDACEGLDAAPPDGDGLEAPEDGIGFPAFPVSGGALDGDEDEEINSISMWISDLQI